MTFTKKRMQTERFRASVQYGDWLGTSAADGADRAGLREWLNKRGLAKEGEFLLGMKMFAGESHGVHKDPVFLEILLAQSGDHDSVRTMIDSTSGPVVVRKISVQLPLLEFFGLFKRFSVAFSSHGMLEEREYTFLDY